MLSVVECFQSGPHFPPKTIIKQQKSADFLSLGVGRLPHNAAIEVFASLIALPWEEQSPQKSSNKPWSPGRGACWGRCCKGRSIYYVRNEGEGARNLPKNANNTSDRVHEMQMKGREEVKNPENLANAINGCPLSFDQKMRLVSQ